MKETPLTERKQRIELMDAARGLSVCMMVVHHFCYDLCAFCGVSWALIDSLPLKLIHYVFASVFVLLSGVSCNFSHSNVARGLKALVVAMGITVVTWFMDMPIVYGVLHLLGTCMLLYGLTRRFWERLNEKLPLLTPVLCAVGTVLTAPLVNGRPTTVPHLWMFGLITPEFYSSDYFPLPPWVFVFLFGAWAGKYIRAGRMPPRFYEAKAPRLAAIGRHSLLIYVAHQPLLYALTMLIRWIGKR